MKKVVVILTVMIALAGCGNKQTNAEKTQARQDAKKAEVVAKKCLPSSGIRSLRTRAGRVQFFNCAVPKKNRRPVLLCAFKNVHGVPTPSKVENAALLCAGRYS